MNQTKYICPYCQKEFQSYDELKNDILINHRNQHLPVKPGQITLFINKQSYQLVVEPEWTLYYVIHDVLGLVGTKQFCDRGACGSCTVIMDGRPVLSCMLLAVECDGKFIETIEGIAAQQHPLIKSYTDHHAMQCGYCTPGFVVSAKALLDRNENPTTAEIKQALAGNLCRCGTYPQHPIAIVEAAKQKKVAG